MDAPGSPNLSQVVQALQALTRASYLTQQTLEGLKPAFAQPPSYTVAALPVVTAANQGQWAYASNARNTGEGAGLGTGALLTVNKSGIWACVWSGVAPTV